MASRAETSNDNAAAATGHVKSADRVMAVLDLLAANGSMSFREIVDGLGLPKSSGHALLLTMHDRKYIALDPETKEYRLGNRIWELAQSNHGIEDLRTLMKPLMDRLVGRTEETVQLAVLDGVDAVYLGLSESPHPVKLTSKPGARLPAHTSAIGKSLLASLDPEEVERRLGTKPLEKLTEHTKADPAELIAELERVRERGYSVDDEEFAIGLRCMAMPVRDATGRVVAAMSVSVPTPRYSSEVSANARQALAETVAEAAERLGRWQD
jgi:IclR family KDG regulon transcriptional repressor